MAKTSEYLKELRESWEKLAEDPQAFTECFYENLFEIEPDAAAFFSEVDMPSQQIKLAAAIQIVVKHADNLTPALPALAELGRRHAGYGVTDAHYNAVREALLRAVSTRLGSTFTSATREAWSSAYDAAALAMQAGAAAKTVRTA